MYNTQNLIPAQKGEIRNPNGRPRGSKNLKNLTKTILLSNLDAKLLISNRSKELANIFQSKSTLEAIIYVTVDKALSGDIKAISLLLDIVAKEKDQKTDTEPTISLVQFI